MPRYTDLIADIKGFWSPEDGDQLQGTVLQVGWDQNDELAADIQPSDEAPIRVRIGDKFWKDWSKANPSQGDLVRITYRETPLMPTPAAADAEKDGKTAARYEVVVLDNQDSGESVEAGEPSSTSADPPTPE